VLRLGLLRFSRVSRVNGVSIMVSRVIGLRLGLMLGLGLGLTFLANVNSHSRSLYAIARPSVVCL